MLETLLLIGHFVLILVLLALSAISFLAACMACRVLVDLIRAGPAAADRAYADGASLKGWWNGTYTKRPYWLRD